MNNITLIMAYYENASMLRKQFGALRAMSALVRDHVSVIIVDDGSPTTPAKAEDLNGMPLQIYRIKEDIRWNQDAARNIGARHAETNWLLLTDMDHMVPQRTWEHLISYDWKEDRAYQFTRVSAPDMAPYKSHPNSWFLTKRLYDKAGGYDERFAGFYGTDSDFRNRLRHVANMAVVKAPLIRVPRTVVADASTTSYLRKQEEDAIGIARVKAERAKAEDQRPVRYRFAYDRVA
jgi:hypothetical protein